MVLCAVLDICDEVFETWLSKSKIWADNCVAVQLESIGKLTSSIALVPYHPYVRQIILTKILTYTNRWFSKCG